ncbi:14315_t:CDS:2, partial [Cetraspora pellucida]
SKNFRISALKEHTKTKDHIDSSKNDILLNKFKQLTHLGRTIEAPYLIFENYLIIYENNTYARELLFSISTTIEKSIWEELSLAMTIGITVDESTDISTESHIIIYVKYLIDDIIKI